MVTRASEITAWTTTQCAISAANKGRSRSRLTGSREASAIAGIADVYRAVWGLISNRAGRSRKASKLCAHNAPHARPCKGVGNPEFRFTNHTDTPYIQGVVNIQKGGDPVSHCHSPRSSACVSWILASTGVQA